MLEQLGVDASEPIAFTPEAVCAAAIFNYNLHNGGYPTETDEVADVATRANYSLVLHGFEPTATTDFITQLIASAK